MARGKKAKGRGKARKRKATYVAEVRLLERGFVPRETKHGAPFRGKNKIVIA